MAKQLIVNPHLGCGIILNSRYVTELELFMRVKVLLDPLTLRLESSGACYVRNRQLLNMKWNAETCEASQKVSGKIRVIIIALSR